MAKTEDIEAKLAAYIDGELDANQRAEIEKHLKEHPKHRSLIHELMAQKDLLKAMPRQAAPADLAEAFTAQLERAVLLGDVDADDAHPPMRIGFFQQFRAVAAVLLLTAGLAVLIVKLLPRSDQAAAPLADSRVSPFSPENGVVLERSFAPEPPVAASTDSREAESRVGETFTSDRTAIALSPGTTEAIMPANPAIAQADINPPATNPTVVIADAGATPSPGGDAMFTQLLNSQMKLSPDAVAAQEAEVVKVVRSGDISYANRQVTQYLDNNNIKWEQQPMPGPLELNERQVAMGSRLQTQSVELKSPLPVASPAGRGRGGRGGGGLGSEIANTGPTTTPQNEWLISNGAVAVAGGDNTLVSSEQLSQRIVARQVPRSQARQVMTDLDTLQSQMALANNRSAISRANVIDIAPGYNQFPLPQAEALPEQAAPEAQQLGALRETLQQIQPAAPAPATFPVVLRLVPNDPLSFLSLHREPLTLRLPATQPIEGMPPSQPPVLTATHLAEDLVDVVILLEPESTPTTRPATQPADVPAP